ncbi:MAG: hypothetical protein ACRD82_02665, partial [Blastocatellia bacterium]
LPPDELHEFKKKFSAWQKRNGHAKTRESVLIETTRESLPPSEMRRFKRLLAKSEQQTLTEAERQEYLVLAEKIEKMDVRRVEALAKLANLRGQALRETMREIGWQGGSNA